MAADPRGHDPKTLWQDQEPETDPVTLEHIHDLARKLDRKTRFTPVVLGLGLVLIGVVCGYAGITAREPLLRVTAILAAAGALGSYAMIYRMAFPSRDPAEPASTYLRRRLLRKLSYQQGGWTLVLLPVLPAILLGAYHALSKTAGHPWVKSAPLLILGAALVVVSVINRIKASHTGNELHEVDELMKR